MHLASSAAPRNNEAGVWLAGACEEGAGRRRHLRTAPRPSAPEHQARTRTVSICRGIKFGCSRLRTGRGSDSEGYAVVWLRATEEEPHG